MCNIYKEKEYKNCLDFVGSYCGSHLDWKLEYGSSCSSQEVLPMDWVNVSCTTVSVAGVFLSPEASVVGIVELDKESLDGVPRHLPINQHSSAAVGQPIEGVNVVNQDNLTPDLELEYSLKGGVLHTASVVCVELLHSSAVGLCLDGVEFPAHLVQLGLVACIDLGICAIDVKCLADGWSCPFCRNASGTLLS